jgi:type I site-specific restriction endonuclease
MDNNHVFEQVNQHTDFIIVDDCHRYLDTGLFYDSITGGMTVNPKNNHFPY